MNSKSVFAVLGALTVGTALLLPTAASAQERNAYLAVKFGPYFPTEDNVFNAISSSVQKFPTKYEVDGALGAYWGIFGLQLNVGFLTTGTSDADVKSWPVLAIARLRLPLGFVAPYAEGGAGVAINSLSLTSGLSASNPKVTFTAVGGFGVDFYLGALLLGAEAKYLWLNPEFGITGGAQAVQSLKLNGITVQAYIGYMW